MALKDFTDKQLKQVERLYLELNLTAEETLLAVGKNEDVERLKRTIYNHFDKKMPHGGKRPYCGKRKNKHK